MLVTWARQWIASQTLRLFDEDGMPRLILGASKDGSGLDLFDESGKARLTLAESKARAMLGLLDEKGKVIWKAP